MSDNPDNVRRIVRRVKASSVRVTIGGVDITPTDADDFCWPPLCAACDGTGVSATAGHLGAVCPACDGHGQEPIPPPATDEEA